MHIRRIALAAAVVALGTSFAPAQTTTRVSVATGGGQGNDESRYPSIAADGRLVAFQSSAANLVAGDTNASSDIFIHDRQTGQTTRVSVATGGAQGNNSSERPSISPDGRFVAFHSYASNLVAGDINGACDVFVHDRQTGETTRVSVATGGEEGNSWSYSPSISSEGRFVAFQSSAGNLVVGDTNGTYDVFVHDRQTGQTTRVSVAPGGAQGNSSSYDPSISADGRFVAFYSSATNLVAGDTNGFRDIFVHDRQTGQTTRMSVATGGAQANDSSYYEPSISADGRFVAFYSLASNLVAGDTNATYDVFVHDRQTGHTTRVSVATGGAQGDDGSGFPSISANGRFVAFHSWASNLVAAETIVSGRSHDPFLAPVLLSSAHPPARQEGSGGGRELDNANALTFGGANVFVHDRQTGQTTRVSVATGGGQGNNNSGGSAISADGRFVAFYSLAFNLVAGDTNGSADVFVHDRCALFPCAGDANGDGVVVFADITRVLENWGMDFVPCTGPGDANHDGVVNFSDITKVLENWATTCP